MNPTLEHIEFLSRLAETLYPNFICFLKDEEEIVMDLGIMEISFAGWEALEKHLQDEWWRQIHKIGGYGE